MEKPSKLAIRSLAEFLLASGSIDNRFGGNDRALEGARIHRRLQKEGGPDYQSEVSLSLEITHSGRVYELEGRADGIFPDNGLTTVDEIKSTGAPMELIHEDFDFAHWGQAYCYAYILSVRENLEQVGVRLTYFQADTGEIRRFCRCKSAKELDQFVHWLLDSYEKWASFQSDWKEVRTDSIKALTFPFDQYRMGQHEMAAAVYRAIREKERLFCQAPTGIGKTISTLFPSVKALGEGFGERIFYLTAKTTTRQAAEEAFALMRSKGLRMKTVTLTAKDKICFLDERDCNPEACPYADGYYDRARDAMYSLLTDCDNFTREKLEEKGKQFHVCPFELSLDLSLWCDGIICDYNYLFDPVTSLRRFFGDKGGDYIFLIDEAHNLPDRARDMYSAELMKSQILAVKRSLGKGGGELRRSLKDLNDCMIALRKECGEDIRLITLEPPEALCLTAARFSAAASEWLESHKDRSALRQEVLELFFAVSFFLRILELFDDHYRVFTTVNGSEVLVRLLCLDPSALLSQALSKGRSAAIFSATLSPLDYYREVLGGGPDAKRGALSSPFSQENLCLLCCSSISTKFKDRENSLLPIARLLFGMVSGKKGNYLVYFPSYRYMMDVYEVFHNLFPNIVTLLQTGDMNEAARESFLLRFDEGNEESLLAFCVLGGVFSEGVDLKGGRLIGAAVIGVGLPQIGPELDLLRDYYQNQCGMGYEYAYRYPGMNKVLQAAGRVIRGADDRGVVLLIDSRFPGSEYQRLFPPHWNHWKRISGEKDLSEQLNSFWYYNNTPL